MVNQAQARAQLSNSKGKAHSEEDLNSYPSGLSKRLLYDQGMSGLGETLRLLRAAAESSMVVFMASIRVKSMVLNSCQVAELLAPILVASHPDREVKRQFRGDLRIIGDFHSLRQLEVMGKGLNPVVSTSEIMSVSW